eukprot:1370616-Rhodomonas_salina.4
MEDMRAAMAAMAGEHREMRRRLEEEERRGEEAEARAEGERARAERVEEYAETMEEQLAEAEKRVEEAEQGAERARAQMREELELLRAQQQHSSQAFRLSHSRSCAASWRRLLPPDDQARPHHSAQHLCTDISNLAQLANSAGSAAHYWRSDGEYNLKWHVALSRCEAPWQGSGLEGVGREVERLRNLERCSELTAGLARRQTKAEAVQAAAVQRATYSRHASVIIRSDCGADDDDGGDGGQSDRGGAARGVGGAARRAARERGRRGLGGCAVGRACR